jgi:NADH-quinone oxidoreductase subunit H
MNALVALMIFPGGAFMLLTGLFSEWVNRKLIARLQNRVGPRLLQPFADVAKLLLKEEIVPEGANAILFSGLPLAALAGALTAALYVPLAGLAPAYSFPGDLIVAVFLLSLLTVCLALAGATTNDRFALIGATRTLTQLYSYESPFLLALLGPALVAGSWQISAISDFAQNHWLVLTQPIGLAIAFIGLMGKLELPPFDAPDAHTEIVAGGLTEYGGRGLALFRIAKDVELVIGLSLIAAFYLGGTANVLEYALKTFALLLVLAGLQTLFARLRIDQTVGLWWRYGALLALAQLLAPIVWKVLAL